MGPFGKPATPPPGKAQASGKPSASPSGQAGPSHGGEAKQKPTGKNAAKANSAEGGKAFGSPTTMGAASGSGFEPNGADTHHGGGDRWSYGSGAESAASSEWGSGHNETWERGSVWERDGWRGNNERGSEW